MCVGPIFVWLALFFIRPFWQTHACSSMRTNAQMALFLTGEAPYIRRSTMKRVLDTASTPLYSRYEVVGLYVTGLRDFQLVGTEEGFFGAIISQLQVNHHIRFSCQIICIPELFHQRLFVLYTASCTTSNCVNFASKSILDSGE